MVLPERTIGSAATPKSAARQARRIRSRALSLFSRTSNPRSFNIAAYHSPHSLTWSWILSVSFDGTWRKPSGWLRLGVHPYRDNNGLQVTVALPFMVFHRHGQREMWFRDLFRKARDREDELEELNSELRRELAKTRATAMAGLAGGRSQ